MYYKWNYIADKESYSELISRNENFLKSCSDKKIYIKRYTHDGDHSSPGYDRRYTVYEAISMDVATGKLIIKQIAKNIKEVYLPFCRLYSKTEMKIAR